MGSPHTFMHRFRQDLHAAGVRFAITSGQACDAAVIFAAGDDELDQIAPPLEVLLP